MNEAIQSVSCYPLGKYGTDSKLDKLQKSKYKFFKEPTQENFNSFLSIVKEHRYKGVFHQNNSNTASFQAMKKSLERSSLSFLLTNTEESSEQNVHPLSSKPRES